MQLSLQSVDKTEEEWSDDVSFPIEFSSYSASYYDFNGVRLNHDDKIVRLTAGEILYWNFSA